MIPALVAQEIRESILDYLRTTWALSDRKLERALFDFLEGKSGDLSSSIFRGPYLRIRLPFSPKPADAPVPLDIHPSYPPYLHQLQAWQRLSTRDGAEPQPTLVTTGTGSGKTECFMYPLLDHCCRARERGEGGIKAIILYPMNALAADQARRFAEVVAADERLSKLRVGMYVGGEGTHREMTRDAVIDRQEPLQKNPPDILLTNYRMLDLLLLRPKDQPLWRYNKPGTLRYLVLDELHTYDGAQGTDVACLIRRLMARLGGQDAVCPVGTSATVASDAGDAKEKLLTFASAVFDQPFAEDAVIAESRRSPPEFFALFQGVSKESYPANPEDLDPEPGQEVEAHARSIAARWFPEAGSLKTADAATYRLLLGQTVMRHPLARAIVSASSAKLVNEAELDQALCERLPAFKERSELHRRQYATSMLTLLSWSQKDVGGRALPLLQIQVQLWVREVRRLLRLVSDELRFMWRDEHPQQTANPALPMYHCRECGHSGWLTKWKSFGLSDELSTDYAQVAQASQGRDRDVVYLHQDRHASGDEDSPLLERYFNVKSQRLETRPAEEAGASVRVYPWTKVSQGSPPQDTQTCPACGTEGALSFLASRSATLASVAVGHLYTTPLNTDRKLLAFSDSVQDASHRAGFFSGRTYRFSIRSGMLAVVPEQDGIALDQVADAMFEYWAVHAAGPTDASAQAAMVAAFLPHDLEFLPDYQDYVLGIEARAQRQREAEEHGQDFDEAMPQPSKALLADLRQRLRWEVTREFGVASRIGRTLERSGTASVSVDGGRLEKAIELILERVPNRLGTTSGLGPQAFRQFVVGLLNRLRFRGGILDELLKAYFERGGDDYALIKKQNRLISPFGPRTTRPIFLSNHPVGRFDNVAPRERPNWYSDWALRSLGLMLSSQEVRDLYSEVLPLLTKAGILQLQESGAKKYWGLRPEALFISRNHAFRVCAECGYEQSAVSGGPSDPLGHPCPRYRCRGVLQPRSVERESRAQAYYRRFYERKALGRVWSREHTGLLERNEREDLELSFKYRPRPDSPNMLSCTPTLEMGIDIGDLSATMLCSVPPTTANYIQRVGRAGRSTGNALVLTFAASQQHDLHFYEDPMAVMDGAIRPPGCYLDAPEVLKRQALAFFFDHFARTDANIPGRVRELLSGTEPKAFPRSFFEFVAEHRRRLTAAFFELFGRQVLRPESREKLVAFLDGAAAGSSSMEQQLARKLELARNRRDELRGLFKRATDKLKKLESDETAAKQEADPAQEQQDLRRELGYLRAELAGLLDANVWNWLCDASLLPNYAFPEAGVLLQAFVRSERADADTSVQPSREFSWIRAPQTAISELAPYNTFYGSGHKVQIDNIAVDRKDEAATEWQFCAECHHSEPVAELDVTREDCPCCGALGFRESGRRRFMVKLSQVRAFTRQRDSVVSDEGEDRERAFYELHNFYEVTGAGARNAWSNEPQGFGFELLPQLRLRRINFGQNDARANASQLGGRTVRDVSFVVCEACGQVRPLDSRRSSSGRPKNAHRGSCPARNKPEKKQPWKPVHLYRELQSEAIRLVLPISKENPEQRIANIRAALRLGLNEFYGGEPDHLAVDSYDEPAGDEGRRNFLIIQDMVPGGTGLLAELTESKGAKLHAVLLRAREAIERCPCRNKNPKVGACYRCLYAYREQRHLHLLDRETAVTLLDKLIEAFGELKAVATVGELRIDSILESELEHRFRELLKSFADRPEFTVEELEDEQLRLRVAGRTWRYVPQVSLAENQVLHKCRPDFLLVPEGQESSVLPVAGFADGAAYHVLPKEPVGRIHDDFKKREGIVESRRFVTWSFGWDDLDAFERSDDLGPWADGNVLKNLETLINRLGLKVGNVAAADPVRALLGYLIHPMAWPSLAGCLVAAALHAAGKQAPEAAVKAELNALIHNLEPKAKLHDSVPDSDHFWTRMAIGSQGEGVAWLSASKADARLLHTKPEAVHGVLRLSDSHAERSKPSFVRSWRMFLRAYNLLQFLPNVRVVTDEQLSRGSAEDAPLSVSVAAPTVGEQPGMSKGLKALLSEIAQTAPEWEPVVREAFYAGFTDAVVPFEYREPSKSGDIELGWPAQRVGAYFDDQRHTADHLAALGWVMFKFESTVSATQLLEALRRPAQEPQS